MLLQNRVGIQHILVTGNALDVSDETDAARIPLLLGIVQALGGRKVEEVVHFVFHRFDLSCQVLL